MTQDNENNDNEFEAGEEMSADSEINSSKLVDADFSALERSVDDASATEEIRKLTAEVEDNKNKYLRALADLENYKKRALKERSDLVKYQGERVWQDLLEVIDNFELAIQHADAQPEKLKEGVELIYKMFMDILKKWDIKAESGMGKEFDPQKFAAISKVPIADVSPGMVINELKKAYFYKDKLLRVGEVVVASEPPVQSDEKPDETEIN